VWRVEPKAAQPGGALVLAGILSTQASQVAHAYAPYCTDFAQTTEQGWVRLAAIRRSASPSASLS